MEKQDNNGRLSGVVHNLIVAIYVALLGISVMVILMFSGIIDYAKPLECLPNAILLPLGLVFVCGLNLLCNIIRAEEGRRRVRILLMTALLIGIQIYTTNQYYFRTDWDVRNVTKAALDFAYGRPMDGWSKYFSKYPNNLLLVFIYSFAIRIADYLCFSDPYFGMIAFQCVIYGCTGYLLYSMLYRITHSDACAILGYGLYVLLVWMSPWVTIPYSDSVGLVMPILILYIYIVDDGILTHLKLRWFFIGLISLIGFRLKPQIIIMTIAIVMMHAVELLKISRGFCMLLNNLKHCFIGIICGLMLATLLVSNAINSLKIPLDADKEIGVTSYIMMGLNTETKGVFNEEDRNLSINAETRQARKELEIRIIKERVSEMGVIGIVKQLIYKTLTNYNDGTFSWGKEGTFYLEVPPSNGEFSALVRSIYYNRNYKGEYFSAWANFVQSIWLSVLCCSLLAIQCKSKTNYVMMLSIVGLTLFELIFEARARYFFIYTPIYIMLAVL